MAPQRIERHGDHPMNVQRDPKDSHPTYTRSRRLTLLFGAVLTSLVAGFLVYDSWVDYRRTLEAAEQRLTSYRVALAEHARTTFNSAQWVLDQAHAYLNHRDLADVSEGELRQAMQALIQHFPQIGWINIVNADAVSIANTAAHPVDKTPLDYRDYMRFHRNNASTDTLFFSKPEIGALTQRWRFLITRRLSHPDGSLAGVIGCAFDPAYYDGFYQKLDLGRTGRFLLIRDDGQILVQWPFSREAMNTNLSDRLLFTGQLPQSASGVFRNPSAGFDASDRIISYQRVEPFPLIATVSMTYAEISDPWKRRTLAKVAVALVPLLAAAWLGFVLIGSLAQRERAANALAESERKFRAIFDHAPYGIAINSLNGRYLDVNQACADAIGLSREEMLTRSALDFANVTEEEATAILEGLQRHGVVKHLETTAPHRDGSLRHILYSSVLLQIQDEARILSMTVDITDQKRAEAALRESEATLRGLFSAVPVGLVILQGRVLRSVNDRICEITGYPRTALEGYSSRLVYETDEEFLRVGHVLYDRLWETGFSYAETRFRRADGTLLDASLHAAPLQPGDPSAGVAVAIQDITEQKRAEAALRASEERLRDIANNVPGVVYQFYARPTGELGLSYFSARAEQVFGITPRLEDAFAEFTAQITPEDREPFLGSIQQAVATARSWDFEGRFIKPTGELIWFKGVSSPKQLAQELVFTGIMLDITERKQTEEKLRASMEYQRALLDNFPFLVWLKDAESRFLAVNALFAHTVGFDSPEALIGQTDLEVWPADLAEAYRADDRQVLASGEPKQVEELIEQAGQPRRWFETYKSPVRVGDRILGTVGYARDITERKQVEEMLRLNESRMTALLELSRMPAESERTLTDFALEKAIELSRSDLGYLAFFNEDESIMTMYSWSKHAMEECMIEDKPLVYPVETTGLWGEAIRQRKPVIMNDYRAPNVLKKGYPQGHVDLDRHMNIPLFDRERIVLVAGVGNKLEAYDETDVLQLTLLMDGMWKTIKQKRVEAELERHREHLEELVTERTAELRQAMTQLVQAEKLAALGKLVAGIAHELNTPVGNAVLAASTLADREREFTAQLPAGLTRSALQHFIETVREGSAILQRNLHRAAELISNFKQVAVDQASYQRRAFALEEVVQEIALALSPTLRRSPATLAVTVDPGLRLDSFPGPLGQVLMNLITNALVHAFAGRERGVIRIESIPAAPGRVGLRVSDDGNGIDPAHLSRLFDPFFTTRLGQGGSGLGLHIVYNLVTGLLGGTITVHSIPGQGATFDLDLPLIAPSAENRAEANSSGASTPNG